MRDAENESSEVNTYFKTIYIKKNFNMGIYRLSFKYD